MSVKYSMTQNLHKFNAFVEKNSEAFGFIYKAIFLPVCAVMFYVAMTYLDNKYVTRDEFDGKTDKNNSSITSNFDSVGKKLDILLLKESGRDVLFDQIEKRLAKLELKVESLSEKK